MIEFIILALAGYGAGVMIGQIITLLSSCYYDT